MLVKSWLGSPGRLHSPQSVTTAHSLEAAKDRGAGTPSQWPAEVSAYNLFLLFFPRPKTFAFWKIVFCFQQHTCASVRNNLQCDILENTNLEVKCVLKSLACHFLAECKLPKSQNWELQHPSQREFIPLNKCRVPTPGTCSAESAADKIDTHGPGSHKAGSSPHGQETGARGINSCHHRIKAT